MKYSAVLALMASIISQVSIANTDSPRSDDLWQVPASQVIPALHNQVTSRFEDDLEAAYQAARQAGLNPSLKQVIASAKQRGSSIQKADIGTVCMVLLGTAGGAIVLGQIEEGWKRQWRRGFDQGVAEQKALQEYSDRKRCKEESSRLQDRFASGAYTGTELFLL